MSYDMHTTGNNNSAPISIIIPIHNAFSHVKQCIDSVLKHTLHPDYSLVLIDDASTDKNILEYLASVQSQHSTRVTVITLEENVGFVQAVNHGFRQTQGRDVVLLNSDTIVYEGWLSRLATIASSHPDTGSITPVSNEASIYSVARDQALLLDKKSLLPDFAHQIAQHNASDPIRIPTAVGFCMYIPWKARQIVGVFNEAFGRGYGEENDWCMRAAAGGFSHYLDTRTFVFHEGGASMLLSGDIHSKDSRTVPEHEALLQKMHPQYVKNIDEFRKNDTTIKKCNNDANAIATQLLRKGKIVIAHVLHNGFSNEKKGGTEQHVQELTNSMTEAEHFILYPVESGVLAATQFNNSVLEVKQHIPIGEPSLISSLEDLQLFTQFLKDNAVSVLHIHQLIGSTFSLISAAKVCGVAVIYSIHDYYALGSPQLLNVDGLYTGVPLHSDICPSNNALTYKEWQDTVRPLLESVDTFIAPSQIAIDIFASVYPFAKDKCLVQEHGTQCFSPYFRLKNHTKNRICFLGYVHASHKGRELISALIPLLIAQGIEVYFLGTSQSEWQEIEEHPDIHFLGHYQKKELSPLLHCINPSIVCLLSNWPETYSYTLTECFRMRIPVCASSQGALRERITRQGGGVILHNENPHSVMRSITESMQEPLHSELCKQIDSMIFPTISEVAAWYFALYTTHQKAQSDTPVVIPPTPSEPDGLENNVLPNFLIIGAQKCGTTWLWKLLSEHPDIYIPGSTECEFFTGEMYENESGISDYSQQFFSGYKGEHAIGEKTASYFWASNDYSSWNSGARKSQPSVPEKAYMTLGKDTKIIVTLRHPVERALSAYCHHLHHGSIAHSGNFLETAKQHGIIHMGFYASHLRKWLEWFPLENIHIIIQEDDVITDPQKTLRNVQAFLGVNDPHIIPDDVSAVLSGAKRIQVGDTLYAYMKHTSATQKKILAIASTDELQKLYDIYLPDIQELEKIIKRPVTSLWTKEQFNAQPPILPCPLPTIAVPTFIANTRKKSFVYSIFSGVKDIWTDFGEPCPNLVRHIRNRILGRKWPIHSGGPLYSDPSQSYSPTFVISQEQQSSSESSVSRMMFLPGIHLMIYVAQFDEIQLRKCLNAITDQTYTEWKVTIVDASASQKNIEHVIHEYNTHFPHKFIHMVQTSDTEDGRSLFIHHASEMYISILRMEEILLPYALEKMMVAACNQAEFPDMIYSDHDECLHHNIPEYRPVYKPQWSPEQLLSQNYIRSFFLIKKEVLASVITDNRYRSSAYTYDILLRLSDGNHHIIHVPTVLSHVHGDDLLDPYFEHETKEALELCLQRRGVQCAVIRPKASINSHSLFFQIFHTISKSQCPKVTIIIPTKDRVDLLKHCIESIKAKTVYPHYEIVIVDNNSTEKATAQYFESIPETVLRIDTPTFNFAHINNQAVSKTDGEFILLLNNDTEPLEPLWLTTMVGTMLLDPSIGVVGARLLYPPSHGDHRVQSIGMIVGRHWASLVQVDTKEERGYENYNYVMRNCSAIGGACLLTRRKLFNDIGGLDENKFGIDFGDVDYCLRVQQEGYRVICNPLASCIHYESATRGNNGGHGANVDRNEVIAFENKWGHMFGNDPFYNPHFSLHLHHKAFTVNPETHQ
jgi:GT2 family glycosyltransferase